MRYVSVIFTPEPGQWGLRGDPFLWRLLKERYQAAELPYPPEALREDILRVFADLTGELPGGAVCQNPCGHVHRLGKCRLLAGHGHPVADGAAGAGQLLDG